MVHKLCLRLFSKASQRDLASPGLGYSRRHILHKNHSEVDQQAGRKRNHLSNQHVVHLTSGKAKCSRKARQYKQPQQALRFGFSVGTLNLLWSCSTMVTIAWDINKRTDNVHASLTWQANQYKQKEVYFQR
jgi:hypothetical protein